MGPNCSLSTTSTKFPGMTELIMAINMWYGAITIFFSVYCFCLTVFFSDFCHFLTGRHFDRSFTKFIILKFFDDDIVYHGYFNKYVKMCDMVPSQISPVKLVFGVITKLASILTGSKYQLTGRKRNLVSLSHNDNEIVYYMFFQTFMSYKIVNCITKMVGLMRKPGVKA